VVKKVVPGLKNWIGLRINAGASLALRATLLSSMRCKRARANKVREREKEIQEEISNAMSV
jgi:hypothetical protein